MGEESGACGGTVETLKPTTLRNKWVYHWRGSSRNCFVSSHVAAKRARDHGSSSIALRG